MSTHEKLKGDFRNFLYLVWGHLGLPEPTRIQYDIAKFLQHGPQRRGVKAFRGVGKSYITAAYVLWRLYCNPHLNIIVMSASKPRADAFTTFCLRLIDEMDILEHLRPRDGQRRSMISFDVGPAGASQTPSMYSVGVFGNVTGYRADEVVEDDVEVPNNSETQTQREKLKARIREADAILKPGGRITVLGTPQTEDSIYSELPERGYVMRVWTSEYPSKADADQRSNELAPMLLEDLEKNPGLHGKPTEPSRFPEEELVKRRLAWGPTGYSLQYMLDTRLSDVDRYPLKVKDLVVFPLDLSNAPAKLVWSAIKENIIESLPNVAMQGDRFYRGWVPPNTDYVPYEGTVMYIDPAGRGKDETAVCVVSMLHGQLFLRACLGLKGYEEDTLRTIAKTAKQFKVGRCIVEPNFGDGMFTTLMRRVMVGIHNCSVEEDDWQSGQKERRILDVLEPVIADHRLVVDQKVVEDDYNSTLELPPEHANQYRLMYQLTRVTREKGCLLHDDRLDALAGAVRYWMRALSVDVDTAVKQSRERALDEELEKFEKNALGKGYREKRPSLIGGW